VVADLSYVLPFRSDGDENLDELTSYLRWLRERAEVIVVDGSTDEDFARHHELWSFLTHVAPLAPHRYRNGKVNGVLTGLAQANFDKVILADDDVRYDAAALSRMEQLLEDNELVRPQNFFATHPWHAMWDTGRTLLNRSLGRDYPGTLGVRRDALVGVGGYDGDVLFENLELIRTVQAAGGRVSSPLDLYVARIPPTVGRFLNQRVRQAYDDFSQPLRMVLFLAVLPALVVAVLRRRGRQVGTGVTGIVVLAEVGRRRSGGRHMFPPVASLLAPLWVLERGVCVWIALAQRVVAGGAVYRGERIRVAANSRRTIGRRLGSQSDRSRL